MSDPRTPRLEGELEQHLREQLEMLADRCDAYYGGKVHEAKSAAAVLYILLCDKGGSQKSLFGQLGLKQKIRFLDSRHRNKLCINSAKGAWPTTVAPFQPYSEDNFVDFDKWWNQEFLVWFNDVSFSRAELVEAVRNKEGGGHIAPLTLDKLAAVRRARSGWIRSITENGDGTTQLFVGIDLSRKPVPEESNIEDISDYELASICAIAEEVLYSITPEEERNSRLHC